MRRVGGGFTEPPRIFGVGKKAITYHLNDGLSPVEYEKRYQERLE